MKAMKFDQMYDYEPLDLVLHDPDHPAQLLSDRLSDNIGRQMDEKAWRQMLPLWHVLGDFVLREPVGGLYFAAARVNDREPIPISLRNLVERRIRRDLNIPWRRSIHWEDGGLLVSPWTTVPPPISESGGAGGSASVSIGSWSDTIRAWFGMRNED